VFSYPGGTEYAGIFRIVFYASPHAVHLHALYTRLRNLIELCE
jgi:hypothetical protein